MESKPLVSVCIPVYNGEKYICQAVDSVFSQTYENLELIVIDNASRDNTVDLVGSLLKNAPFQARLIQNDENIGFEGNWNKCLDEAAGDFIKILPADDLIYPDNIKKQLQPMLDDDEVAMASSGREFINGDGKKISSRNFFNKKGVFDSSWVARKMIRSGGNYLGEPGSILFRKSAIGKDTRFDCSVFYVVDLDFYFKVMSMGKTALVPDILGAFRVSDSSLSVVTKASQVRDYKTWYKSLHERKLFGISQGDITLGYIQVLLKHILKRFVYVLFINRGKAN